MAGGECGKAPKGSDICSGGRSCISALAAAMRAPGSGSDGWWRCRRGPGGRPGCGEAAVACCVPCAAVAPALPAGSARLPRPPARGSPRLCPLEALGSPPAPEPPLYIGSHRPQPAPALTYMAIYGKQEALIWMRAGGPRLASAPGTGESRAVGAPARPGLGAPRPLRACPPAVGSAAAAPPQRRQPRGAGSLAPPRPGQPAGSPRRTFHIREQPYKSRFRRRLPAPYMAIPAPGGGGAGSPGARARLPPGRAPAPGPRERAEAPGARGCCPGRRHGGSRGSARQTPAPPPPPRSRGQSAHPRAPAPICSAPLLASPRLRGGAARRRLTVSGAARSAAALRRSFPGAGSAPRAGAACSRKRGISGTPEGCPAPPAPAESGGALPAAADRGRPGSARLPHAAENGGAAKTRAPGTAQPQPPSPWARPTATALGTRLSQPRGCPLAQPQAAPSTGPARRGREPRRPARGGTHGAEPRESAPRARGSLPRYK